MVKDGNNIFQRQQSIDVYKQFALTYYDQKVYEIKYQSNTLKKTIL